MPKITEQEIEKLKYRERFILFIADFIREAGDDNIEVKYNETFKEIKDCTGFPCNIIHDTDKITIKMKRNSPPFPNMHIARNERYKKEAAKIVKRMLKSGGK